MCGICGLYDLGNSDLGDGCEEIVRTMVAQLSHLDFPNQGDEDNKKSEAAWAEEVEDALVASVRLRLRADVPVGVYLSGVWIPPLPPP